MSKADCISYLRTKLGIPENFQKIFTKIWGASRIYIAFLLFFIVLILHLEFLKMKDKKASLLTD